MALLTQKELMLQQLYPADRSYRLIEPVWTPAPVTVSDPLVIAPESKSELLKLLPKEVISHRWYGKPNWDRVSECIKALVAALKASKLSVAEFFAASIFELYNKDRAELANSITKSKDGPIQQIPQYVTKDYRTYYLQLTELRQWVSEIPHWALGPVAKLSQRIVPDSLHLAQYIQYPDPIIYAKYGDWYVEIVRWE
jgi:hypothetical protein